MLNVQFLIKRDWLLSYCLSTNQRRRFSTLFPRVEGDFEKEEKRERFRESFTTAAFIKTEKRFFKHVIGVVVLFVIIVAFVLVFIVVALSYCCVCYCCPRDGVSLQLVVNKQGLIT